MSALYPRSVNLDALPATAATIAMLEELERRLLADQAQTVTIATSEFVQYETTPLAFVDAALGGFLWSKQREILESIVVNRRTAVKSCHDVGKSAVAARAAAWWLSCHEPGEAFVVTSAPTFRQVRNILWREINKIHRRAKLPGRTNQVEWHFDQELVGFGVSPADADPDAFQGIHARYVLVIFDEACGIAKSLWDAADTLIANDDSRFLAIGNPDDPETQFASVCKPGSGWNVIRISAWDSPNFTSEDVPRWLKPLLISPIWVEEKRRSWGEGSPLWISKIDGEFPETSSDGLVPINKVTEAQHRKSRPESPCELGVDVARFGNNDTIITSRRGYVLRRENKLSKRDTMFIVGEVVRVADRMMPRTIKIDDIGLGGGVTDRLRELKRGDKEPCPPGLVKCEIVAINVALPATGKYFDSTTRFANARAELNWELRRWFVDGLVSFEGECSDYLAQGSAIKYHITSSGEVAIEKKEDMAKRLQGASPDSWDSAVLAIARPQTGGTNLLEFMRAVSEESTKQPDEVRLKTSSMGTFYGISGKAYSPDRDGIVTATGDDVAALQRLGFTKVENDTK